MADLLSQLSGLQADFKAVAHRAPRLRVTFGVKAGQFSMFSLGQQDGDGTEEPMLGELEELTNRAGVLFREIMRSSQSMREIISLKSAHYLTNLALECWLGFLMFTPPYYHECRAKTPNGEERAAHEQFDYNGLSVWIDTYPQLCLTVLSQLKAGVQSELAFQLLRSVQHQGQPLPKLVRSGEVQHPSPKAEPCEVRPLHPTRAYCLRIGMRIRWMRTIKVQPRFHRLLGLLLDRETSGREASEFYVPFSLVEQTVYDSNDRLPKKKSISNMVGQLNKRLKEIDFPYEYGTENCTICRVDRSRQAA